MNKKIIRNSSANTSWMISHYPPKKVGFHPIHETTSQGVDDPPTSSTVVDATSEFVQKHQWILRRWK